jgi:hypothetical protein
MATLINQISDYVKFNYEIQKVATESREIPYSTLTSAALSIGHHFAISAFCKAPSACGES